MPKFWVHPRPVGPVWEREAGREVSCHLAHVIRRPRESAKHQAIEQFGSRARAGAKALPSSARQCPSHQALSNCPQDLAKLLSLPFQAPIVRTGASK